jgi:ABC-type enterochelin transport system permease subunit
MSKYFLIKIFMKKKYKFLSFFILSFFIYNNSYATVQEDFFNVFNNAEKRKEIYKNN